MNYSNNNNKWDSIQNNINFHGNEYDMKQLVTILLDNAIKNTPINGKIHFILSRKNHHPVISITNTGSGISEEIIPHLFERFYKTDSSRSQNSYGLGLAIAKAIADAHNGTINVTSELGKSTTFTVIL